MVDSKNSQPLQPELSPEQETEIEHYVDQGFNYPQALHRVTGSETPPSEVSQPAPIEELSPTPPAPKPQPQRRGRNRDGSVDLRTLSPRQRLSADKMPPDYFPYKK